ncbi:hypothetical protein ACQRIT_007452 [Beauveria bassiana]
MTCLAFIITSSILLAQAVLGKAINVDGSECPKDWTFTQFNDKIRCCYGSITINNDGSCCVQGSGGDNMSVLDITKIRNDEKAFPSQQCVDEVPFSASDYSQRVSAASKSAAVTQTSGSQPSSNSASATKLEWSYGTSATPTSGSGAVDSGSGGNNSSSPTTVVTNGALAITPGVVQVGGIVAVAVLWLFNGA